MKLVILRFFLLLGLAHASNFQRDFEITWGHGNARVLDSGNLVSLSLDRITGSGFESKNEFLYGKIDIQMKLVPGNSAGTVAAIYFSSLGATHDEIDLEFLGNLTGQPYTLHTNVFTQGRGGREQQFYLWFDPTKDFHTYSILWNPQMIKFMVDGVPVRQYKNLKSLGIPYPTNQPMRIYGSIWNADSWATRGGLVKTNWSHAPFTASFRNFHTLSCLGTKSSDCSLTNSWFSESLDSTEEQKMKSVRQKYMVYDYCSDSKRFTRGFPGECTMA